MILAPRAGAQEVDPIKAECHFVDGGYSCDDPKQIIEALTDYQTICGLDSVVCESEKEIIFEAIRTSWIVNDDITVKLLPPPPIHLVWGLVEGFKPPNGCLDLLEMGGGEYRVIIYSQKLDVTK